MGRRGRIIGALALVPTLAVAVPALATFQPQVTYDPPQLRFQDLYDHLSAEDAAIAKAGNKFTVVNSPASASTMSPQCDFIPGGVECPVSGIERVVARLGDLGDKLRIDLGSKARKVRQLIDGEDGPDRIKGGPASRRCSEARGETCSPAGPDTT